MVFTVISLPNPLILLIHLHILEYPHANNPEYDHNIFNPRFRGLRERVKLMEDVSYFLVGRVEGGKNGARIVLPIYPCVQPSETVAFRTSLAKYLDNLRHPTSVLNTQGKGKGSDMAWWWKNVTVRKSLLEECVGEKFERVLLALSTHALMKKSSTSITLEATSSVFHSQPFTYMSNLANYQSKRHVWSRRASLLTRRREDLARIQKLLLSSTPSSIYSSFSIRQLQTMIESKKRDLSKGKWAGQKGQDAFNLFIELVGLNSSMDGSGPLQEAVKDAQIKQPPLLPIAAAHHPSHLKKLRRSVFQNKFTQTTEPPSCSHAEIKLLDNLESEKRMRQALVDRISQTQRHQVELVKKLKVLKLSCPSPATNTLDLWSFSSKSVLGGFDLDPKPAQEMLASLSLPVSLQDEALALETRIQQIREDLLAPYPPIPDPSAPRLFSSKIRQTGPGRMTSSHAVARNTNRKSIRFSIARKGRPSLFRIGGMQDVVNQLVDATGDLSDPESNSEFSFATPKVKTKINRIWTSGTPKSAIKNAPRESFPMSDLLLEPAVSLPSLLSAELLGPDETDDLEQDVDFTPIAKRRDSHRSGNASHTNLDTNLYEEKEDEEDDIFGDDPPSMTLREILLNADTSHFHLLEEDQDDAVLSGDDTSFVWE